MTFARLVAEFIHSRLPSLAFARAAVEQAITPMSLDYVPIHVPIHVPICVLMGVTVMTDTVPSIPLWLAHLPTVGGLAIPWITPRTEDGRHLFGAVHPDRIERALRGQLCGVCGRLLEHPIVLLMRLSDLPAQGTVEPALHPQCAAYTIEACPMVAGRLSHYRATPMRLDPTMAPAADTAARLGASAEPWFSVWLPTYRLATVHGHLAAPYGGITPLRIRPITWRLPDIPA